MLVANIIPCRMNLILVWLIYDIEIGPVTDMRRITTFRSTTDRIHDTGPIILYYNIML